mgnify:CR=1 FL=1
MTTNAGKGAGRRKPTASTDQSSAMGHEHETGMAERRDRRGTGGSIPRRALADGVVERRRASARGAGATTPPGGHSGSVLAPLDRSIDDQEPRTLTAEEHYRLERQRRSDRLTGDLEALLAEAKAEYEELINAPRPAGKGGRPRKKPVVADDDDL